VNNYKTKMVIVWRNDLKVRKGKFGSQIGHAVLGIFTKNMELYSFDTSSGRVGTMSMDVNQDMIEWFENSFAKICLSCDSEEELLELYKKAEEAKLPCILITDNGTTEFHGVKTNTCIGIGPAKSEEIDKITGHLKLV